MISKKPKLSWVETSDGRFVRIIDMGIVLGGSDPTMMEAETAKKVAEAMGGLFALEGIKVKLLAKGAGATP